MMPGAARLARLPQPDSPAIAAEALAVRAYLVALVAAFSVYLMIEGASLGVAQLGACLSVLIGLAGLALLPSRTRLVLGLLDAAATAAAAAAVTFLLYPFLLEGGSVPDAVAAGTVWPEILVTIFAGRLVASVSDLRFVAFWSDPLGTGHARTQSLLAAVLTGCGLTLLFYKGIAMAAVEPGRVDPIGIAVSAFAGKTVLHVAIVALFFVVIAAILDAARVAFHDGAALDAARHLFSERAAGGHRSELTRAALLPLARYAHTRTFRLLLQQPAGSQASPGDEPPLEQMHRASRRLLRSLISFLPLMGFLGTVIGLTAAIGGLPGNLGPQARQNIDISASLVGLAVKFETTLLGLVGALVASLLLALLEKREGELAAECRHLVRSVTGHD